MGVLFKILFGNRAELFLGFRERAATLTVEEYRRYYEDTQACNLLSGTDLNDECMSQIPDLIVGQSVLEVGCGRGELANILRRNHSVVGTDIVSNDAEYRFSFCNSVVEQLPFLDNSFDTVICTHVLEHVLDFHRALNELRRVSQSRVIVVLPCERPYLFGFNLHISFFPYRYSVEQAFGMANKQGTAKDGLKIEDCGGDWLVVENQTGTE